jgi:zinc transporter 1/2/3
MKYFVESRNLDADKPNGLAAHLSALFILEFGIIFHSILMGITLAVSGEELTVLYVVLVFHRTFEGLGLGSRLAIAA